MPIDKLMFIGFTNRIKKYFYNTERQSARQNFVLTKKKRNILEIRPWIKVSLKLDFLYHSS